MHDSKNLVVNKRQKALLVGFCQRDSDNESFEELRQLANSAQFDVLAVVKGRRSRLNPATYIGAGKIDEITSLLEASQEKISIIIFNNDLTPIQERNLANQLGCAVIDRTSLILDIFAQRAKSHEGKLQVELAQLEHLSTKLVRGWTHLERQKGGIGLRGPGETQLETDRRLLAKRVKFLKEKLIVLQRQRNVQRLSRKRLRAKTISIVGYTNAGKSTLFNRLTRSNSYAADQLFATLDTTTRKLFMPDYGNLIISDTVGFIRELPHTLIAAFRATLEETIQADLLLHVVDGTSLVKDDQIAAVNKLLEEINASTIPQILIFNKIDQTGSKMRPGYVRDEYGRMTRILISAKTGEGLEYVKLALTEAIRYPSEKVNPEDGFLPEKKEVIDNSAVAF